MLQLKGEKKRGRMKLLLMQILIYFTEINNIFLTKSVYFRNKNLELIQNTLFMDVEKNTK